MNKFNLYYFTLYFILLNQFILCNIITIEYYDDYSCILNNYGVGITSDTCIQYQSNSLIVNCSSLSLNVITFNSTDCSGIGTNTIISDQLETCSSSPSSFSANNYLQSPLSSYKITCDASSEWTTLDSDYILSRTTTVLQATSAIDFTLETCAENTISKPMQYCFLNSNNKYCLPTDTDSDSGSSNSICLPAPVMYAYPSDCIQSATSSRHYTYFSNNHGVGVFRTFTDSVCYTSDSSYQLPYSECLGCNRFKDLKNSDDNNGGLAAGAIVAIVIISICCFFCCAAGAVGFCFPAVFVGFTACILCRKTQPQQNVYGTQSQPDPQYNNTGVMYPQVTTASYPQQTGYVVNNPAGYPTQYGQPAYVAPPPVPNNAIEIISVQVPMDAKPGQMILVPKQNGQQIQVQLPPDTVPGSIIQIQG